MGKECKVEGCSAPHSAKGYCERHYTQFRRHGHIISAERLLSPRIGVRRKGGYVFIFLMLNTQEQTNEDT